MWTSDTDNVNINDDAFTEQKVQKLSLMEMFKRYTFVPKVSVLVP